MPIFLVSALGAFTGVKVLNAVQDNKISNNTANITRVEKVSNENSDKCFKLNGRVSKIEGKVGINGGERGITSKN